MATGSPSPCDGQPGSTLLVAPVAKQMASWTGPCAYLLVICQTNRACMQTRASWNSTRGRTLIARVYGPPYGRVEIGAKFTIIHQRPPTRTCTVRSRRRVFFVRSTQRPIHFRPSVLIKSNHTQSVFRIPARFMADEGRSAHTDNGRARTVSEQVDKVKLVY